MKTLTKAQLTKFLSQPDGAIEIKTRSANNRYAPSDITGFFKDIKTHRKTLLGIVKKYPLFSLKKLLNASPSKNSLQSLFILEVIASYPQWESALREHCSEKQVSVLNRLLTFEHDIASADTDDLPSCLTSPGWEQHHEPLPQLSITPLADEPTYQWDKHADYMPLEQPDLYFHSYEYNDDDDSYTDNKRLTVDKLFEEYVQDTDYADITQELHTTWNTQQKALWLLGIGTPYIDNVLASHDVKKSFFEYREYQYLHETAFYHLPKPLVIALFNHAPQGTLPDLNNREIAPLLYWLQDAFLEPLLTYLPEKNSKYAGDLTCMVGWYKLAPYIAQGLNNRWVRQQSKAWLLNFCTHAVHGLLPNAFMPLDNVSNGDISDSNVSNNDIAKIKQAKKDAQRALMFLAHHEQTKTTFLNALAPYTAEVKQAVSCLVARADSDDIPEKLPDLPKNLYLPSLPQLILKNGLAIPTSYLSNLLQQISLCLVDEESNAVSQLKEQITTQSLARFCRALFRWYEYQGKPSKFRWMFSIQGHVGDDETVRLLSQVCKSLRADKNRVGAYDALYMLTQIGSDAALMYIDSFANQKRYNDLKERAEDALSTIASERGLTLEQLADRTVPDLGLDHTGKLTLDFGARQFIISFNEFLQPLIFEADDKHNLGKLRKTLPKPAKKDDATLATAATQQFKDLKKQLKSIASMQVKRLEQAMCDERSWNFDEFERFFVTHPLMRHLSQRLAWSMYESMPHGARFVGLCRITEELTFTDENDDDLTRDDIKHYRFSIGHAINIPSEPAKTFSSLLQDYELLQPFEQLGRNVYLFSEDDVITQAGGDVLSFWQNKKVTYGSIMGLQNRHWTQDVGDGGMVYCFDKSFESNGTVHIISFEIKEGWYVMEPPRADTAYDVVAVYLNQGKFSELSKITYSEMQRDLHLLAWFE